MHSTRSPTIDLSRRSFLFYPLFAAVAACGSTPSIFPGVRYQSEHAATPAFVTELIFIARNVGFVEDPSQFQLDTEYRFRHALMRWSNRKFPALAIDTHKPDAHVYVTVWDASVGGAQFPEPSAAVVRQFEAALQAALPGVFSGGIGLR